MADSFDGKVAWVTGGASGFGAGVARRLTSLGATVVISDIDDAGGQRVAEETGATFVRADVSDLADNEAAVAAVLDAHGRLDVAFLNAGISSGVGLGADFDLQRYRRAMGINLDGVVFGMHCALGAMGERGGDIVATASLAGLTAVPFDPFYGANKHAVVGLVRAAGQLYAAQGVRINALCPGFADTAILPDSARQMLAQVGVPILPVERVVDAFVAAATSGESGQCWFIQPGHELAPYVFHNLPGPRDENGQPVAGRAGQVVEALTE